MEEELEQLKRKQAEIAKIEKQISSMKEEIVSKYAPVKEGDIVDVTGYSFNGKKMRVEKVVLKESFRAYEFCARGTVLKKDGTLGSGRGEWRQIIE